MQIEVKVEYKVSDAVARGWDVVTFVLAPGTELLLKAVGPTTIDEDVVL